MMTRTASIIVTVAPIAVVVALAVGFVCGWVAFRELVLADIQQMRF